jgi:hypothetical protein
MGHAGQVKVLADYTWDTVTDRFRDVYTQTRRRSLSQQHTYAGAF